LKNTTFVLNCPSQERTPLYKAIFYIVYIYFGDYFLPYFSVSQDKLKLNRIRSSTGVQITGPSITFTWHSHTPRRRFSDTYWSFGQVM